MSQSYAIPDKHDSLTLAGGCFWCLEAVFKRLRGVHRVVSGYCGGQLKNPSYEAVCSGKTGHAEAVQVVFDPSIIGIDTLLTVFFTLHDPTTLNRQGHDLGTQYRSAVFYRDESQRQAAFEMMARLTSEGVFANPIVTEVVALTDFYPAEAMHDDYYDRHPQAGYCLAVISPKIAKLRASFSEWLR